MKSPRLTSLLPPASAAPLPAATAGLLLAVLAVELALPRPPVTARAMAPPVRGGLLVEQPLAIVADRPAILRAPIFAPDRRLGGGDGAPGAGDDFVLLGTALSRRGGSAAVRAESGALASVAVGGRIGRWRLVAVSRARARFVSADGVRTLVVGASRRTVAAVPPPTGDGE